jgi:hypothetical protein
LEVARPQRAGVQRLAHDAAHRGHFLFGGGPLGGAFAHHVQAQRRVADQGRDVDRAAALLDEIEVLGKGLEAPVAQAFLQRRGAHAFHLLQRLDQQLAVVLAHRRDAEAAVAHHHRRHAVPRRDRQQPVPQHLRVVVRVHVDEARHTTRPVASMVRAAWPGASPRATTRPSLMPTSPRRPGLPVPSTRVPPLIFRS